MLWLLGVAPVGAVLAPHSAEQWKAWEAAKHELCSGSPSLARVCSGGHGVQESPFCAKGPNGRFRYTYGDVAELCAALPALGLADRSAEAHLRAEGALVERQGAASSAGQTARWNWHAVVEACPPSFGGSEGCDCNAFYSHWWHQYICKRSQTLETTRLYGVEFAEGQEEFAKKKAESVEKLQETRAPFDEQYPLIERDVRELLSAVETQGEMHSMELNTKMYDTTSGLSGVGPAIPALVTEGLSMTKRAEKAVEKDEKDFEKGSVVMSKAYGREAGAIEKQGDKTLEKNERKMTSTEKAGEKMQKKQLSSNTKYLNAETRKVGKLEEKVEREEDDADTALADEYEHSMEEEGKLAAHTDKQELKLEKTANRQEKGEEQLEKYEERFFGMLENGMQDIRNKNIIKAAGDARTLQDAVKNVIKHIVEMSDVAYGDVVTTEGLGRDLQNSEEMEFKSLDAKVKKEQRTTETARGRMTGAFQKSEKRTEDNRERMDKALTDMDNGITKDIANMKTVGTTKVSQARSDLEAIIGSQQTRKSNTIDKEAEEVLRQAEMRTDDTAAAYEKDFSKTAKGLSKTTKDFEKSQNSAYAEESRSNGAIAKLAKLDAELGPKLVLVGDAAASQASALDNQAAASTEESINQLVTQAQETLKALMEQADSLSKEQQGLTKDLAAENAAEVDASDEATNRMSGATIRGLKEVANFLKPVVESQLMAEAQLGTAQDELGGVVADASKVKVKAQEQLGEVGNDLAGVSEEIHGKVQEQFAKEDEQQTKTTKLLTQKMDNILQRLDAALSTAAASVREKVKDAQIADAQRTTQAAKRDQAAQMELTREQTVVGRMETEFGPKYAQLLGHAQEAEAGVHDVMDAGAAMRTSFRNDADKEAQEKIAGMSEQMREGLDEAVVKDGAEKTKVLGTELQDARAQAGSDKSSTSKAMDEAVANAKAALAVIVAKINKLHEEEAAVDDESWSKETGKVMDALKASQAQHQAKFMTLEEGFAAGEDRANRDVAQFHMQEHKLRTQFGDGLSETSHQFKADEDKAKQLIGADMTEVAGRARASQRAVDSEGQQVRNSIEQDEDRVGSEAARDLSHLKQVEREVGDQKRVEFQRLQQLSATMNRERLAEQARQQRVERDLGAESRGVHGEVQEMESGLGHMMDKLDPSAALSGVSASIKGVGKLMEQAQGAEHAKAGQVDRDAQVAGGKIDKIMRETQNEDSILTQAVMEVGVEIRDKLRSIKQIVEDDEHAISDLVKSTEALDGDVRRTANNKVARQWETLGVNMGELERAVGLSEYEGEDAMKKVFFVLEKAAKVDAGSTGESKVLELSTEEWRKAVETTFEGLGMALDLEKVERMAAESMAAEEANEGKMMDAKKALELEIMKIKHKMQNEIDWVRAEAKKAIDAILADESLSEEEKQRRIKAIRDKADRDVYVLKMKMHQLISDQYMAAKSLDEDIGSLGALLERAKIILESGTPEAARWAKAMMREAKAKLDQIRKRYAQDYSLAQTNSSAAQTVRHQIEALEKKVQAVERAPPRGGAPSHQARAAAFLQAGEELACLESERSSQQDQWSDALDVLQRALPALTRGPQ